MGVKALVDASIYCASFFEVLPRWLLVFLFSMPVLGRGATTATSFPFWIRPWGRNVSPSSWKHIHMYNKHFFFFRFPNFGNIFLLYFNSFIWLFFSLSQYHQLREALVDGQLIRGEGGWGPTNIKKTTFRGTSCSLLEGRLPFAIEKLKFVQKKIF